MITPSMLSRRQSLLKIVELSTSHCTGATKEQGYRGLANWDPVKQIKEVVSVPVSGSGDVTTIEGAFAKFRETGCDGALIGRGAMANPWIFRQIEDVMHGRRSSNQPWLISEQSFMSTSTCLEKTCRRHLPLIE